MLEILLNVAYLMKINIRYTMKIKSILFQHNKLIEAKKHGMNVSN